MLKTIKFRGLNLDIEITDHSSPGDEFTAPCSEYSYAIYHNGKRSEKWLQKHIQEIINKVNND